MPPRTCTINRWVSEKALRQHRSVTNRFLNGISLPSSSGWPDGAAVVESPVATALGDDHCRADATEMVTAADRFHFRLWSSRLSCCKTADPDIPQIAIFADGRGSTRPLRSIGSRRTSTNGHPTKRTISWPFGHEDLQRFKSGESAEPTGSSRKRQLVTGQYPRRKPSLIRLLAKDPVTQPLEFMVGPDVHVDSLRRPPAISVRERAG